MAYTNLKLLRSEATGPVFANPSDPDLTVRFRSTSSPKSLNGVSTKNYTTEIVYNDSNSVVIAGTNAQDAVSVRLRVSGSNESMPRIAEILACLSVQLSAWTAEKVFVGFNPDTVPKIGTP